MTIKFSKFTLFAIFLLAIISFSSAQKGPEKSWNSARTLQEIEKLKHVGRVLYIAAHPDDENTQLISYLANVKDVDVAYMSLTRGDGGQDLLGPEVREELGVIRTQELLMARSVDGGQQFFSRANDFGFSKTAKETLHIWDSTEVLSDIVWVIRNFKPDIIITRFSPTYAKTHGHHTASAILAQVAFADAADSTKFPEQLKYTRVWQAKSLFWNTSTFFFQDKDNKFDTTGLYHTDIGAYMPLLGKSVGDMAAESRTMHKSQGMGSSPRRGDFTEYFVCLKGEKPFGRDIFSDYNWDWSRIKGCEKVSKDIDKAIKKFDAANPVKSLDILIPLWEKLQPFAKNYLVSSKIKQFDEILLQCAGIYAEAINPTKFICPGDTLHTTLSVISLNSGNSGMEGASIQIGDNFITTFDFGMLGLSQNSMVIRNLDLGPVGNDPNNPGPFRGIVPISTPITGPYWLEQEHTVGMYNVTDRNLLLKPENPLQLFVHIEYQVFDSKGEHVEFSKDIPVFYKTTDPTKGDVYSLVRIVPPAVVIPQEKLLVYFDTMPKQIHIKIKSFKKGDATLRIFFPYGWEISDATYKWRVSDTTPEFSGGSILKDSLGNLSVCEEKKIYLKGSGAEQNYTFIEYPHKTIHNSSDDIAFDLMDSSYDYGYNRSFEDINYDHIPEQMLLPKSKVKVVRMDIKTHPKLIGYINGAGDDIPAALKEMGYKVEMIAPSQIATINLSKYDAIIAGIRAYNTITELKYGNSKLMEYVKNGGNYIVQYNTTYPKLVTDSIGPYPLHVANVRTTEEDCKVTFLNTSNPVFNTPNKITQKDFDGWVQERGLYYPDKWDTAHYVPLLQMNDAGEAPTKGALLVAQYGKGNFVYTGLVFFRELPAGVPGAYRLMANLIELEKH